MCFPVRGNPRRWGQGLGRCSCGGGGGGGSITAEAAGRALSKLQSITQRSILLEPVFPRSSPAQSLRGEPEGEAPSRWSSPNALLRLCDVLFMVWAAKRKGVATLVRRRPSPSRERWYDIKALSRNLFHIGYYVAINKLSSTPTPLLALPLGSWQTRCGQGGPNCD